MQFLLSQFSYHYIEPSRYIYTDKKVTDKIVNYLEEKDISYLRGITWTTDAMFRETEDRIELRKEEGAKIVEMEQSGCIAVAQYRRFDYGAIIYGGDDVSQEEWSNREWRSRKGIRYDLVMLCKELLQIIYSFFTTITGLTAHFGLLVGSPIDLLTKEA